MVFNSFILGDSKIQVGCDSMVNSNVELTVYQADIVSLTNNHFRLSDAKFSLNYCNQDVVFNLHLEQLYQKILETVSQKFKGVTAT